MDVEIELYKTQYEFVSCKDRFTAMLGGIGSGKSLAGSVKANIYALPKTVGLVIAPSYRMLQDATIRTFREVNDRWIAQYNKSDQIITLTNGAEILFRSADEPDRLRGPNAHWAWIDEAGLCQSGTWDIVIGRLRADGGAGPCWITSTPKGRNWLYQKKDQMKVFHAPTIDNPYLSKEFVDSLLTSYTGEFLKQEVYGEFARFEGIVYPMFDQAVHIKRRNTSEFTRWALACDEGYTNPAVILLVGIDGDERWHVVDEYHERGKLESEVVKQALAYQSKYQVEIVAVDSAAAGLIASMRDAGLPAQGAKGRVLDGIKAIQERLKLQGDGKPRLTFDPSCVSTINEFESYCWKPDKDEPVKENDHAPDALRYLENALAKSTITVIENPFYK